MVDISVDGLVFFQWQWILLFILFVYSLPLKLFHIVL